MSASLPPLHRADLDPATLAALFADLGALATIDAVRVKGAAAACTLAEAQDALTAGAAGVQIRYRWGGSAWLDTILRTPTGLRIVRMPIPATEDRP